MSTKAERDWRLYADDIVEACGKVRRFVAGMTYDAFAADERTRDAVIRNIEIIGEAAGNLPKEVTARAPQIPWRLICDMRNVLAHAYFGVSLKAVWDTATTQIDELLECRAPCVAFVAAVGAHQDAPPGMSWTYQAVQADEPHEQRQPREAAPPASSRSLATALRSSAS